MSNFINKARDKIEAVLQKDNDQNDNPRSSNVGPHSSNVANKADPRVDSDRDHRNDPTSRVGGYGDTQTGPGYGGGVGQSDTYDSSGSNPGYDNPRSTTAGPHSSNLMNKADPRVDSDRDGRNDPTSRVGGYGNTQQIGDDYGTAGGPGGLETTDTGYGGRSTGNAGYTSTGHTGVGHSSHEGRSGLAAATTTGYTGTGGENTGVYSETSGYGSGGYDTSRSSNTGPHKSNLANKLDPRVDSDRDNRNDPTSRVGGYGTQDNYDSGITGAQGGYGSSTQHSTSGHYETTTGGIGGEGYGASTGHSSNEGYGAGSNTGYGESAGGIRNEGYSTGTTDAGYGNSSYTPGSGKATKTAGPHDSDIMNKLDPRVDSDMDGSKTYGGNQTHR